jgi:hypothetical protein
MTLRAIATPEAPDEASESAQGLTPLPRRGVAFVSLQQEFDTDQSEKSLLSFEGRAKQEGMLFTITDVPSLAMSALLGAQHLLTMVSAVVLIPLVLTPAMGVTSKQTAEVISTILVVSGMNTLLQTNGRSLTHCAGRFL